MSKLPNWRNPEPYYRLNSTPSKGQASPQQAILGFYRHYLVRRLHVQAAVFQACRFYFYRTCIFRRTFLGQCFHFPALSRWETSLKQSMP